MAKVLITLRIMPESLETSLEKISEKAVEVIRDNEGELVKKETKPIAFGLSALEITFLLDESKAGKLESLEESIKKLEGVQNAEVIDVRRTFG
ncbi:MAG: elongation factor 1-beta [Candidatus Pacearchaeota archaeon]